MNKKEIYINLIDSHPEIDLKGKNNLYTSLNGHMFSFIGKEGTIAIRFSEEDKKTYNEKHGTGDVKEYGAIMRGYVALTDEILKDKKEALKHLQQSLDYIKTLKPKRTKKKK